MKKFSPYILGILLIIAVIGQLISWHDSRKYGLKAFETEAEVVSVKLRNRVKSRIRCHVRVVFSIEEILLARREAFPAAADKTVEKMQCERDIDEKYFTVPAPEKLNISDEFIAYDTASIKRSRCDEFEKGDVIKATIKETRLGRFSVKDIEGY